MTDLRLRERVARLAAGKVDALVRSADGSLWLVRGGRVQARWNPAPAGDLGSALLAALVADPRRISVWPLEIPEPIDPEQGEALAPLLGTPVELDYDSILSGRPPAEGHVVSPDDDWDNQPDLDSAPEFGDASNDVSFSAGGRTGQDGVEGSPDVLDRKLGLADVIDDIAQQRHHLSLHGASDPPGISITAAWLLLDMRYELHSFEEPRTLDELRLLRAAGDPDANLFDGIWIGREAVALLMNDDILLHRSLHDASLEPETSPESLAPVMAIRLFSLAEAAAIVTALVGRPTVAGDSAPDALVLNLWSDAEWRFTSTSALWELPPLGPGPSLDRPPLLSLMLSARPRGRGRGRELAQPGGTDLGPHAPDVQGPIPGTPQNGQGMVEQLLRGMSPTGGTGFDLGGITAEPLSPEARALARLRRELERITPLTPAVERVMAVANSQLEFNQRVEQLREMRGERFGLASPTVMSKLVDTAINTLEQLSRRNRR